MNKLREAAEMALEALENVFGKGKRCEAAITALRQALAAKDECETCAAKRKKLTETGLLKSPLRQALAHDEQEPFAFVSARAFEWLSNPKRGNTAFTETALSKKPSDECKVPLYTAPQEQGCAECGKKASDGWALYCVKCAETFTEQEPVAEVHTFLVGSPYAIVRVTGEMDLEDELFLTAPPSKPWVSLTDDEIEVNWQFLHGEEGSQPDRHDFARAMEAALKEKNNG